MGEDSRRSLLGPIPTIPDSLRKRGKLIFIGPLFDPPHGNLEVNDA